NGIGTPGIYGMVPPGMPGFDFSKVKGYHYDPSLAASYLAQAGYPSGKGLPEITLSTTKEYQDLCEYIQGQLGELGIRIKIDVNQGATHREMVARQKLDFFRGSWIADYHDAENYLALFYGPNHAPAGPNYTHYVSQTFDSLFKSVIMNTNEVERNEKYLLMDQLAMKDAPVVVLYYDQVIRLQANHVSGLGMNAMNLLSLKRVQVKE
ncbi:MAG: ABC transporter substrate-binding protein, partial [Bacteroidota bacterium]